MDDEEYIEMIRRGTTKEDDNDGPYCVISRPSKIICPMGLTYTEYTTIPSYALEKMLDSGWKDEHFESELKAECADWIKTKPDHSLTTVLHNNPELAEKLRRSRPQTFGLGPALEEYNKDFRRGKFV